MKSKASKAIWVVTIPGGSSMTLFCQRCGEKHAVDMPKPIWEVAAIGEGFVGRHAGCKVGPEGLHCSACGKPGHEVFNCPEAKASTVEEWLAGPDTGLSSQTIASVLWKASALAVRTGGRPWPSTPRDPADFGRCHRLLERFPAWRARLPEVAARYPAWTALVREWDALTALYLEELPTGRCPRLYARMIELEKEPLRSGGTP